MANETGENAPKATSTRLDAVDGASFAATTVFALIGYFITLTPSVTLAWSGIMTTAAMYGGVAPPQGYPVWTIYSWLFIHLIPVSNPAWRVAVGSAVSASVACGLVAIIGSRCGKIFFRETTKFEPLKPREQIWIRGLAGCTAGLALAFSGGFWNDAVVADSGAFPVLLFAIVIYLLMRWWETGRRRFCCLAFLVYGLLLTNNQELVIALPGIVCAILLVDPKLGRDLSLILLPLGFLAVSVTQYAVWDILSHRMNWLLFSAFTVTFLLGIAFAMVSRRVGSERKSASICSLCFLLGFFAYLYLPIISAASPPVNWAYPRTLEGFLHTISRGQFERVAPTSVLSVFFRQLWMLARQTVYEFGWPYVMFAVLSFCFLPRMSVALRKWMGMLLLLSFCVGPLLAGLMNFASDRQSEELAEPYFYTLRVPLAVWTGMGTILFASFVTASRKIKTAVPS